MANHRSFRMQLSTANTNAQNLLTLALAQTGAVPTNGIFPNPISSLRIQSDPGNGAATITVGDNSTSGDGGQALYAGDLFQRDSLRNTININDYVLTPSASSLYVILDVEQV